MLTAIHLFLQLPYFFGFLVYVLRISKTGEKIMSSSQVVFRAYLSFLSFLPFFSFFNIVPF